MMQMNKKKISKIFLTVTFSGVILILMAMFSNFTSHFLLENVQLFRAKLVPKRNSSSSSLQYNTYSHGQKNFFENILDSQNITPCQPSSEMRVNGEIRHFMYFAVP